MGGDCVDCRVDGKTLRCGCVDPDDISGIQLEGSIDFDDFMTVLDNGYMKCFGHISERIWEEVSLILWRFLYRYFRQSEPYI